MNNPCYYAICGFIICAFILLGFYSYERREQGYEPGALGTFIDQQAMTLEQRQAAALREIWGDNLNRNIFGEQS